MLKLIIGIIVGYTIRHKLTRLIYPILVATGYDDVEKLDELKTTMLTKISEVFRSGAPIEKH